MKKLFNILALVSLIALSSVKSFGQTTSIASITTGTNVVLSTPYHLLTVSALGTVAQTLRFYDSGTTNLFYTNAAYVSYASYTTNITNIVTATTTGIPQTNISTGTWTYAITNAAATNTLPIIGAIILAANVPVTVEMDARLLRGLAVTTTNSATVAVTYKASIGQ